MRILLFAAALFMFVVLPAWAAEPIVPAAPMVMTATATACGPAITLHIRMVQFTPVTLDYGRKLPVSDSAIVNGRVVERVRYLEVQQLETILRAGPGAIVSVPLDGAEVIVVDLKGKPVVPSRLPMLLKKETAVLISFNGPVDPYFLQTTKPGTLIVQMPASRLAAPAEILPPARIDPNEPPLAKPKP